MSIALVMSSNHLILCHPLLLLPSIFPSTRVFSKGSAVHIKWPKYRSFSFSISPSSEYSGLISFKISLRLCHPLWDTMGQPQMDHSHPPPGNREVSLLSTISLLVVVSSKRGGHVNHPDPAASARPLDSNSVFKLSRVLYS